MFCFRTTEDMRGALDDYHPTTDLDVYVDSLGNDQKIVVSASFIRRILQLPDGDKLLLATLRDVTAETVKERHECRTGLSDDQKIIVDLISERIGVFGPQPEGE